MKKRIFHNEHSLFYKLESLFYQFWEKSFFRFLVIGGLNTLLGILVVSILRFTFDHWIGYNPKWDFAIWFLNVEIDLPNLIMFVSLMPVAYTTQTIWAFQSKWSWKRLLIYPLSSIPNFLLQQLFIFLFEAQLHVNPYISYVLASILPIPIMFFIVRFLVSNKKKDLPKEVTNTEEDL